MSRQAPDDASDGLAARLAAREAQLERLRRGLSDEKRAALERRLRGAAQAAPVQRLMIPRREAHPGDGEPTSFAQERLWFLAQLDPESAAYNLPSAVRLEGALDVAALRRALAEVVRRHASLRTTFASRDGQPVQVVAPPGAPGAAALSVVDLGPLAGRLAARETRRLAAEIARQPFDLAAGPPFRAALLRESPARSTLVVVVHHIVTDAWSAGVMVRELAALYAAFVTGAPPELPELPLQYADYARWQRGWLTG
ncbi:MAG TPA: condensation domain-containing protein, partial [Thermoanaerobaculia bacterium]|nr:condensation domain-containing protein [Thermoanaerobaculia bacterium]